MLIVGGFGAKNNNNNNSNSNNSAIHPDTTTAGTAGTVDVNLSAAATTAHRNGTQTPRKRKLDENGCQWQCAAEPRAPAASEAACNKRLASMENLTKQGEPMKDAERPASGTNEEPRIDANLYSRQIGAFGLETMGKLIGLKVLISGLNGAGVEAAKNLILAGPRTVALHDHCKARIQDLASNFYITEEDVVAGRTRAEASLPRLAELNDYVNTREETAVELTPEVLANYDVVVVCDMPLAKSKAINRFCREHVPAIGFIAMDGFGLAGAVFVDFGPEFTVFDRDGNPLKTALVENIQQDVKGRVNVHPEKPSPFDTGDYVVFREVRGMTEINALPKPVPVVRTGKFSFEIPVDTRGFGAYERDGIIEERRMPQKIRFASLETCITNPIAAGEHGLILADFGKMGRSEQLHYAFQSVYTYRDRHGALPAVRDLEAVQECLTIAEALNEEARRQEADNANLDSWRPVVVESIDARVVEWVVKFAACHISPIAAFLGGVVAQEIVKFTGKFSPLRQWFYFDAFECLPSTDPTDTTPKGCRYDHQLQIWGADFQRRLAAQKIFLVGAGALGCEYLKSLALMGCGLRSEGGEITVTDMDRIEVSNLNRQFLFRRHHVGAPKSTTAANTAVGMNSELAVRATETRVGPETEDEFNDAFWERLDIVINALDNIQSRLYVDGRCVWFHKPLLESGTLGTKANAQVILPKMTQSYGDSQDPPEESIPLCTLRHFPNQIEHTIEWARDAFQGLFCDAPQDAKAFVSDVDGVLKRVLSEGTSATQRTRLEKIHSVLALLHDGPTMEKAVVTAVNLFTSYFDHQIAQLVHTFPLDHVTSEGLPFWSGPKRAPRPIRFDPEDPLHMSFVMAAANLVASTVGISPEPDIETLRSIAAKVPSQPFEARSLRIKTHDKEPAIEGAGDDEVVKQKLVEKLKMIVHNLQNASFTQSINPVEFQKDDDTNYHIDFIWACANLRARNYKIPECDRHKAHSIAGKIIPAIATTTAMVTGRVPIGCTLYHVSSAMGTAGLASLELLKTVDYRSRPVSDFKNAFINLALPLFLLSEPLPPLQTKSVDFDPVAGGPVQARPEGFTSWDVLELSIGRTGTVQQLIDQLSALHQVQVYILSVGNACLYNGYLKAHSARLTRSVRELTESITKKSIPSWRNYVVLEASCSSLDDSGCDVILPTIKAIVD